MIQGVPISASGERHGRIWSKVRLAEEPRDPRRPGMFTDMVKKPELQG